jgi:hypothetical protein
MLGEEEAKIKESVAVAARSKKTPSPRNVGPLTRNAVMPEELLDILADHLRAMSRAGIEVQVTAPFVRDEKQCIGFILVNVEVIAGKIRTLPENRKSSDNTDK